MSKKTDTAPELISEKQETPAAVEKSAQNQVVMVSSSVQAQMDVPVLKEVPEETAQDPNLLISQAQSSFRGYLARKVYLEFKQRPPPVFKLDLSALTRIVLLNEEVLEKYKGAGNFDFPPNTDKEFKSLTQLEDKNYYQGEFIHSKPHGIGTLVTIDGDIYEGGFKEGKQHGFGRLFSAVGDVYIGEFKDGKKNGIGKIEFNSGNIYDGQWKDDMYHGKGIEKHIEGFVHEGEFKNGLKSGFGKSRWPDGSNYEGYFLDDMYEGTGKYVWPDKEYDGEWKNSQMHGKGTFKFIDGRSYSGEYFEGNKHGYGVFRWADDKRYEGQWVGGKQEGQGIMYNKGKKMPGIWKDGKFVEKIKLEKVQNDS